MKVIYLAEIKECAERDVRNEAGLTQASRNILLTLIACLESAVRECDEALSAVDKVRADWKADAEARRGAADLIHEKWDVDRRLAEAAESKVLRVETMLNERIAKDSYRLEMCDSSPESDILAGRLDFAEAVRAELKGIN